LAELAELAAIDKGFENVLLNVEVVVDDGGKLLSKLGKLVDGFVDGVVGNIVGGRLGAEQFDVRAPGSGNRLCLDPVHFLAEAVDHRVDTEVFVH
jgi:hypothetical protein